MLPAFPRLSLHINVARAQQLSALQTASCGSCLAPFRLGLGVWVPFGLRFDSVWCYQLFAVMVAHHILALESLAIVLAA